jgi:hypothetical protein
MKGCKRNGPVCVAAYEFDRCFKRDQRLREVAGIGGNALVAAAKHRMHAIKPAHRRAARTRIALIAFAIRDIAKIRAAGPLQYVATEARHIAELLAGGLGQRLGNNGIIRLDARMIGCIAHAHQGAEPQTVLA